MKELIIDGEKKLIGSGGVSFVYECKITEYSATDLVILKEGCSVKKNIENHKLIQSINLPTLKFAIESLHKGKPVLITEHLNFESEILYVTPNSVVSDEMKILQVINPIKNSFYEQKLESIAEQFRYQRKLTEIPNFTNFIKKTLIDLESASKSRIIIDFDSYFIGSLKNESTSNIDYKIADLDHIAKHQSATYKLCLEENKSEFKRVMTSFVKYFVADGNNKTQYESIINQI